MTRLLETAQKYLVYTVIFLLPLVVTSIFPNGFFMGKLVVLSFGVALALFIWALTFALSEKTTWGIGKFDTAVLLLTISYLASATFITPNKMEALLLPGSAMIVLAGGLLYFLVNQMVEARKTLSKVIFYSGVFTALLTLLAITGVFKGVPQLPEYLKAVTFNSLGGYLPIAIFLSSILPLGVDILLNEKEVAQRLFNAVTAVILILGLFVSVREILPGKPQSPNLVSFNASWNVAVDTIQASPLLGAGAGNYLTAFNMFRSLSYNQTELWNVRFTTARNFYLTVLTETGLLGTLSLIVLAIGVWRALKERVWTKLNTQNLAFLSLLILLILIAIFPAAPYLVILFFLLLSLNSSPKLKTVNLGENKLGRVPSLILSIPVILGLLAFFFFGGRALAAEAKFKSALDRLALNDGKGTYDTLREAINLNPYVDRYHATYSQVNMALANNIVGAITKEGREVTDEDRQTISALIQQAIREAKATTSLNPTRSGSWELLARTYQAIIAFAQGADSFAIESYNQAIALDPINPNLRIALGGLYYSLGNYDEAINVFRLAVAAKPDLANAHYNLAIAYREKGDTEAAINQMTNVLSLVDKDSADFELATEVMAALEEQRDLETANTESLTTPEEAEQILQPLLELPEDSQPPTE